MNHIIKNRTSRLAGVIIAVVGAMSGLTVAHAAPTQCPKFFASGDAPDILRADLVQRANVLCYSFYSVVESGVTRTGLWSAEHLTRDSVEAAHELKRVDSFHADPALSPQDRAEREDYRGSGRDEGHLSPNGDMVDERSQYESFSLGNMTPQSPDNNRHLWQGIEIAVRGLARYDGEVYVVTGPSFVGPRASVGGRVEVPTHMWKAVYDPRRGAAAYVTWNAPGDAYAVISIAELARITGIDPFPALPAQIKRSAIALPEPRPNGQPLGRGPVSETDLGLGSPNAISTVTGPAAALVDDDGRSRAREWRAPYVSAGLAYRITRGLMHFADQH
jgi:endonuclease G, mitochondrial